MKRSKIIAIAVLSAVFILTVVLAFTGAIQGFEKAVHQFLNPNGQTGEFFHYFTILGDTLSDVLLILVLITLPFTTKKVGIPVAGTAIISTVLNRVIKALVKRPRPVEMVLEAGGYSFPSGHAMNNAAIFIGIMLCLLPLCKTRLQKLSVCGVFIFFTVMIGVSRVYFNVHYISDVVCGWCLGSIVAIICTEIFKKENKNG